MEGGERKDAMHLSVSLVSIRVRGKCSSLLRLHIRFQLVFSWARDCTTFTLHDLTDFYVEMVTLHRIKINDHSLAKLKNETKIKTSLGARVVFPWCFGGSMQLAYSAYKEDRLWLTYSTTALMVTRVRIQFCGPLPIPLPSLHTVLSCLLYTVLSK